MAFFYLFIYFLIMHQELAGIAPNLVYHVKNQNPYWHY